MKQTFIMQLIRYGKDDDNKNNTFYISADNNIIEEKEVLRDLGVMMNNKAAFDDHITKVCQAVKQKSGWILRTFQNRNPYFMKQLWKQLVQPQVDYCSQLYLPVNGGKLADYWTRLKELQLLSQ